MSVFRWRPKYQAYVKTCSRCKEVFIGTQDEEQSANKFRWFFGPNSKSVDGMCSWCNKCRRQYERKRTTRAVGPDRAIILRTQDGKCAICEKEISFNGNSGGNHSAHYDHNHKTKIYRSVLCGSCNTLVGFVEHILNLDTKTKDKIFNYLKTWSNNERMRNKLRIVNESSSNS